MSPNERDAYDPGPDLVALRASGGGRVAVGLLLVAALFQLGAFFQFIVAPILAPTWVTAWVWAKFGTVVLAAAAAHAVTNTKPHALLVYVVATIALLVDGIGWLVFSWSNGFLGCYAPVVPIPATVAAFATVAVRPMLARANEARARLRDSGLGDGF